MAEFKITDNSDAVMHALDDAVTRALTKCGMAGETYGKSHITKVEAVDTGNLKNSITYQVLESEKTVEIGTAVKYGIYVEFGTGAANVAGGTMKESWVYKGEDGKFHRAYPMKARPFIKPAVAEHTKVYNNIIKNCLKGGS